MSTDISGLGNNYPSALEVAPNVFILTAAKPMHIRVTWGENPNTPQYGSNISAMMVGPEGSGGPWFGGGTQKGGSVTNDGKKATKVPVGTYTITLTPDKSTNVTVSNQSSIPR